MGLKYFKYVFSHTEHDEFHSDQLLHNNLLSRSKKGEQIRLPIKSIQSNQINFLIALCVLFCCFFDQTLSVPSFWQDNTKLIDWIEAKKNRSVEQTKYFIKCYVNFEIENKWRIFYWFTVSKLHFWKNSITLWRSCFFLNWALFRAYPDDGTILPGKWLENIKWSSKIRVYDIVLLRMFVEYIA